MNLIVISGNLVADPTLRFTPNGTAVTDVRLANNHHRDDKAVFLKVVVFGKLAENLAAHKGQGDEITVTGRVVDDSYELEDGTKRFGVKVLANEIEFGRNRNNRQDDSENITRTDPIYGDEA